MRKRLSKLPFSNLPFCFSWLQEKLQHMSNGMFIRTRQKQKCTTCVWNISTARYTPVKWDRKLPASISINSFFLKTLKNEMHAWKTTLAWIWVTLSTAAHLSLGGSYYCNDWCCSSLETMNNSVTQRAPNVHQQTCTSRWAENSKEWKFFSAARHAPTLRVFNVGPKWVFSFTKRSAEKLHFCTFLGNCRISDSAKKLQKLFGSALSHLIICCFLIVVRVIAQEAPKTLKWLFGCAHLLVHIKRPPSYSHICSLGALWESITVMYPLFILLLWGIKYVIFLSPMDIMVWLTWMCCFFKRIRIYLRGGQGKIFPGHVLLFVLGWWYIVFSSFWNGSGIAM